MNFRRLFAPFFWIAISCLILGACSDDDSQESDVGISDTGSSDTESTPDADADDSDADDSDVEDAEFESLTCDDLGVDCGDHPDDQGGMLDCGSCSDGATCSEEGQCVAQGEFATEVNQYDITWHFDEEYEVGQFVTGDWWVVGPVEIEQVSPTPEDGRNGSMLNPVGAQAYDSRAGRHDDDKGVSFPLHLEPDNSLVSSISHDEEPECEQGGSDGWETYSGTCQRGPIHTQAVLTVLEEAPPSSAFRPPYSGDDKPLHLADEICWETLPDLSEPEEMPEADGVLRHIERPWIDHLQSWQMQHGCATHNMFCYGREIGDIVATVAAFVLIDSEARDDVATHLVQLGIDNYGVLQAGGGWHGDGGHFNGRKFPIVFAGGLLGNSEMASPGTDIGNEDRMTYYGDGGVAYWGRDCTSCYTDECSYTDECDSGSRDCRDPDESSDSCSSYRTCCTSRTWVGTALAARLMGLKDAWDHDPFFDYVDRWMAEEVDGGGGTSNAFVTEMWETHRDDTMPVDDGCL